MRNINKIRKKFKTEFTQLQSKVNMPMELFKLSNSLNDE